MHPIEQLLADREAARDQRDPCANLCTLANIDENGVPQARTLVLRELDSRLAVFVNATSPKWPHLETGPVSIVVWLPTQNLQYRLACTTEPVAADIVAESWQLRPDPPKRMDWYYAQAQSQSSVVASRDKLLERLNALQLPDPLHAPAEARGLYLLPHKVERLDLGYENGVHDRRLFTASNPDWVEVVLTP